MGAGRRTGSAVNGRSELRLSAMAARPIAAIVRLLLAQTMWDRRRDRREADAWIAAGYVFVWQIALFLSLGESFSAFGGAMALAALVGAVGGMFLGRHIDAGHGTRAQKKAVDFRNDRRVGMFSTPRAVLIHRRGAEDAEGARRV